PVGQGLARAVPGDVNTAVLAQGDLAAADRAGGDGALRLAVDAERFREAVLARLAADVEEIAVGRLAFEVNEVQDPLGVQDRLGLNAVVGRSHHGYTRRVRCRRGAAQQGEYAQTGYPSINK